MSILRSAAALCALSLLAGCDGFLPIAGTDRGTPVPFGDGEAQTFIDTDASGNPTAFGVEFDTRFDALPAVDAEYRLPMPASAPGVLPIDHVSLQWNPEGHEPASVFDVAHLDALFFLLSEDERLEIEPGACDDEPVTCDALDRALLPLPPSAQPPGYASIGLIEPFEGDHLFRVIDQSIGEFESAWSYGRWDGEIAFLEASATRSWLETLDGEDCRPIATPEAFTQAGWYPTLYCTSWENDGRYRISLEGFTRFTTADAL